MKRRSILTGVLVLGLSFLAIGAPTSALALNPERHYEMVSPPFKAGFGVSVLQAAAVDGEAVAFFSNGVFANAPAGFNGDLGYIARRGASEWTATPVVAPLSLIPEQAQGAGDMTQSLDRALEMGRPGPEKEQVASEQDILTHNSQLPDLPEEWEHDATLKLANGQQEKILPGYQTSDAGLCLAVLSASGGEPLVPEAIGLERELYQVGLGCDGHSRPLELVALDNQAQPQPIGQCGVSLGSTTQYNRYNRALDDAFNAVSADGSEVFFTVCTAGSGEAREELPHQAFVRLDGARTLEVSRPMGESCIAGEVPCAGASLRASADFQGASEDGSRVYFTAPLAGAQGPLVPGDEDRSQNLYLATIGCLQANPGCAAGERVVTSLEEASHDPNAGQAANVMGVVRVAPDGSRVYFVAGGDLLTSAQLKALELQGAPAPVVGAANLYVFDAATGVTRFIAELCSGTNVSGAAEEARCPSESDEQLWTHSVTAGDPAQTAGADGKFLVFDTYGQLTSDDTNRAGDVYRYDAVSGGLNRVSLGEKGFDDNGNRAVLDGSGKPLGAEIPIGQSHSNSEDTIIIKHELATRAISEDGTRIVFGSAEPLSPLATNGLENAYEWHAAPSGGPGAVSIVSGGDSEHSVSSEALTISPSGKDVFFATTQSLLPQDADVLEDIYDARTELGFPPAPAPVQSCSGDACQGPLTSPAAVLVPASLVQQSGGNFAAVKSKVKARSKPSKCRRGYVKKRRRCVKGKVARPGMKSNLRSGK